MQPEDRLDALLALPRKGGRLPSQSLLPGNLDGYDSLQPLLHTADRLARLGSVEPSPAFTARLETKFLAQVEELQKRFEAEAEYAPPATIVLRSNASAASRRVPRRLPWPLAAAVLLLAIGTTAAVAAAVGPGTPLYGVHRFEQGVQVILAGSAADRTSLHLAYAEEALTALDAATAHQKTAASYDDALATFGYEMRAAATDLGNVGAGADRNSLSARLDQLRAQGRTDLRGALASLSWPDRVMTTTVLAGIGDNVLSVTRASMVYSDDEEHLWRITVTGSGFAPDAVLLVNGQSFGTVISVTPTTLVVQVSGDESSPLPSSIVVADPDDTAAETSSIDGGEKGNNGTIVPLQTPDSDDQGSGGHD
jgi:hypothetical protein